jgi:Zn-finger nucleic acid-binding protein
MHRRNFGRSSGVIVDTCKEHGNWLDACELEAILKWIQYSGEAQAAERERAEREHDARQERIERVRMPQGHDAGLEIAGERALGNLLVRAIAGYLGRK